MEREILLESEAWERLVTAAFLLVVAFLTWLIAHWLARRAKGVTRLGLRGLERLAAPVTLLVSVLATRALLGDIDEDPPLAELTFDFLGVGGAFWLASRALDVAWATGRSSARLRGQPSARVALLAMRHLGKIALVLGLVVVYSVRLGVTEQLYLALGAVGAALTFAARAPISNAIAFVAMMLDPPFHLGDRVRLGDYRGGVDAQGEVAALSLAGVTIRSKGRSQIFIPHLLVSQLRIENLSSANRRRLEIVLPIDHTLPAELVREACEAIEDDLRASSYLSEYREPHVWISGYEEGLRLKVSAWLRRGTDRRDAQRDLLLAIQARFEEITSTGR